MPAVSNTSPLLNLAIIDRLSLLRQQFGLIQIPTAVLGELRVNESLPGSLLLRKAMEDGWIQVLEVSDRRLVQLLQQNLDPIAQLRTFAGFHIAPAFLAEVLKETGEIES